MAQYKKYILFIFFVFIIFIFIIYLFSLGVSRKDTEISLAPDTLMFRLGARAILSKDVPVAAVLMYRGEVIAEGINTVRADSLASGHAELNAITMAIRKLGLDGFKALDRNELLLYSTFEPCLMCAGACVEYDIRHVYYASSKAWSYKWKKEIAPFCDYLLDRRSTDSEVQKKLFSAYLETYAPPVKIPGLQQELEKTLSVQ